MQAIVVAKPYKFIPPKRGKFWPAILRPIILDRKLRSEGITRVECRGVDRLRASLAAGHGIVLAPNHCRPPDPFVVGALGREAGCQLHIMASWHLFMQDRIQRFLLPRVGVFSIYREGLDRAALKCAIRILTDASRPLVIFPEGVISRHNDKLNNFMEGAALVTRIAAKRRAGTKPPGRVVVHPIALRYIYEGEAEPAVIPMLTDIEHRLTWAPQHALPLIDRIAKIGNALLALKEVEYFGAVQEGDLPTRTNRLIDRLLRPLEVEWLKGRHEPVVVNRVKLLRIAMLPNLVSQSLSEAETERRWKHLREVYIAQQLSLYPPGYLEANPTPERIIETVERFEEDLTDVVRILSPFRAIVDVGEAIEVGPDRPRGGEGDPLMPAIRASMERMLENSLLEFRPGASLP